MNTILEKFMFHTSSKSSEDKGAGKAAGDEAIDLSPAAEGPPRSKRVFENPKRGRQAIGVAKQLIEAGEALGLFTGDQFAEWVKPAEMISPKAP